MRDGEDAAPSRRLARRTSVAEKSRRRSRESVRAYQQVVELKVASRRVRAEQADDVAGKFTKSSDT